MTLSFEVKKSPECVFRFLSDPQLFVAVHPVITRMEPNADGSYKMHETLMFGPFRHSFVYQATIEASLTGNTVTMKALVMKIVRIKIVIRLRETLAGTVVDENFQ